MDHRWSWLPGTGAVFSPHPRGWTPPGLPCSSRTIVFPAPAGMDPRESAGHICRARFPRTRGDGPKPGHGEYGWDTFSPHPRGWTAVPRASSHGTTVFPAPAGMDLYRYISLLTPKSFPRTRGDGPGAVVNAQIADVFSPHPRGWTPAMAMRARPCAVFPAPAGMDLRSSTMAIRLRCFPRTRGDGPRLEKQGIITREFSPHPRGWTAATPTSPAPPAVFPAPAGMDRSRRRRPG